MPKINLSTYVALAVLIGGLIFIVVPKNKSVIQDVQQPAQSNVNTNSSTVNNNPDGGTRPSGEASQSVKEAKNTFDVSIAGGRIVGNSEFSVLSGEPVVFNVTSDVAGQFRIDGTAIATGLEKDIKTEIALTPVLVGRFPLKFGKSTAEIDILEVFPKPN